MLVRPLDIAGAYEITPDVYPDDRGSFLEWYRFDALEAEVGRSLDIRQVNISTSRRGVVRGVHFADVSPGQAKYVTAVSGAVTDLVIDIRVGSPTYGEVRAVELDDVDRRSVFLEEGLGHAFIARTEGAVVAYLVSNVYDPVREHGVSPLDPELALDRWFDPDSTLLSEKDRSAPTLAEAAEQGLLPVFADRPGKVV
ncbi:MAG: dTDP-4-dehydrorhamnose 3,5-epimerase [Pseudolysinimonas sp.]